MYAERLPLLRNILLSLAIFLFATLLTGAGTVSKQKVVPSHMGQVVDWSSRHILYPQGTSARALALAQRDPRAYWNYLRIMQAASSAQGGAAEGEATQARGNAENLAVDGDGVKDPQNRIKIPVRHPPVAKGKSDRADWSVPLGAAGQAPNTFPAKFSFDVNATPSCANDYVVYTLDTVPNATQANIVAFNNLYSGTATDGTPGMCGPGTATTMWAYEVSTVALPTSPIISLDGTKVAFVDGDNPAVFHVLTWTASQGTVFAPAAPAEIVDVPLTGGTTDTRSSPFVDYFNDVAYVATDNGELFKITGVFMGAPALAGAPWPLTVGAAATILTGPVIDFSTDQIFLGGADGNLYGFTKGGTQLFPNTIGDGSTYGGLVDSPVVDVVNGLMYVSTGSDANLPNASLSQVNTASFSVLQATPIGNPGSTLLHAGAFNDAYFSSMTNTDWFFYVCGVNTGGSSSPVLYRVGFDATRTMLGAVDNASVVLSANNGEQCSPLTELENGVDRIFLGLLSSAQVEFFDVSTNPAPTLGGTGSAAPVPEVGGTSGIIVDNVSAANQASSIYFSTLGASGNCEVAGINQYCAVKLTQSTLQ